MQANVTHVNSYLSNKEDFLRNFGYFLLEKKLSPSENVQHNSFSSNKQNTLSGIHQIVSMIYILHNYIGLNKFYIS